MNSKIFSPLLQLNFELIFEIRIFFLLLLFVMSYGFSVSIRIIISRLFIKRRSQQNVRAAFIFEFRFIFRSSKILGF